MRIDTELRFVSMPDCLYFSCMFWSEGFTSQLREKKAGWRLNSLLQTYLIEVMKMAGKTTKRDQNYAKSGASAVQWQNVNLSDADVDALVTWIDQSPDLLTDYVRLVSEGYAVGCKPASNGDGFMATIISSPRSEGGQSYGLSAYASTPYDALATLLYKFVSLLGGEFHDKPQSGGRRFR